MRWMILPFRRYFDFKGRSRRIEFWMFSGLNLMVTVGCWALAIALSPRTMTSEVSVEGAYSAAFSSTTSGSPLAGAVMVAFWLYAAAAFIPSVAVTIRRLHDRDMSGWWYLVLLVWPMVPLIGLIVPLVFVVIMLLPGTVGPNRFGNDPKGGGDAAVFE